MKILYVAYDVFSFGGIQRYSRYELRALRDLAGPEAIHVCSLMPADDSPTELAVPPRVVGRGRSVIAKASFACRVVREARRSRPTMVVCDHIVLAPLAMFAARCAHASWCLNVYGLEVWGVLPPWRRRALLSADRVVSDCEFTRQLLTKRFPVLQDRMRVVRDCVDISAFSPVSDTPRQLLPLGFAEGVPRVLTVSRLKAGRSKGHEVVMRALRTLIDEGHGFGYLVVGDGDDRARLERLAVELGVTDSVFFVGRVPDELLAGWYRACDIFVLVSGFRLGRRPEGEGVPLVVLEAQACGKPVVTSKLDGSAESIVDGHTGILVDPHDVDEVGSAIRTLIANPELRERMGVAARNFVVSHFAFEVFTREMEAALPDQVSV